MKHIHAVVFIAIVLLFFGVGWWCRGLTISAAPDPSAGGHQPPDTTSSTAEDEARLAQLERDLQSAQKTLTEQREMLREEALSPQPRAVEELFALLPAAFPAGNWNPPDGSFEDCWFVASDGIRLHGWYTRHAQADACVLYLHGNAGNITHRTRAAQLLRDRLAASVLLFDYRGYGRSEGQPTIEGLLRDARAARDYLAQREGVPSGKVILLGRSLGGALAVQLAADDGARALVLESTFASLREAAAAHYPQWGVGLLVSDRLNSLARIGQYEGPLLISHGDADRTVPFQQGRRLYERAKGPKTFVRIPAGDHNDPQTDEYYRQLQRFVASLPE